MNWTLYLVGTYVIGSIPFGYLIGRARSGIDVRAVGSGNVGATNVMRTVGRIPGTFVLLLDMAKGLIPVLLAVKLNAPVKMLATVALVAVVGHVFSIFLGFRGGKGVATAIGGFMPLAPLQALCVIVIFGIVVLWKRYVSLASVLAVTLFPVVLVVFNATTGVQRTPLPIIVSAVIVSLLILVRHLDNLRRLWVGKESRIEDAVEVQVK